MSYRAIKLTNEMAATIAGVSLDVIYQWKRRGHVKGDRKHVYGRSLVDHLDRRGART